MATLVGATAYRRVAPGDKFRVTWGIQQLPIVGGQIISPVEAANVLLEVLPSAGFAPVSNPSTVQTARAVTIDVRLSGVWLGSWTGKTVGNVVTALEQLANSASGIVQRLTLNDLTVLRVEAVSLTATSTQLEAGQAGAQQAGEQEQRSLLEQLTAWLQQFADRFATGAGFAVVVVVVGGVAYWYVTKRRS